MEGPGPRSGSRDNGLRAARYVAVADLDPRVADALLATLRERGIAAYAAPVNRADPIFRAAGQPTLTDRLFADAAGEEVARALVAEVGPKAASPVTDEEAAWRSIVADLSSSPAPAGQRPWPESEDTEPTPFRTWTPAEDPEDEHYVPPPPPPLPRIRPVTLVAVLAILGGILLLVAPGITGGPSDGLTLVGVVAILAGFGTLVYRMHDRGSDDDPGDDDDGAVV